MQTIGIYNKQGGWSKISTALEIREAKKAKQTHRFSTYSDGDDNFFYSKITKKSRLRRFFKKSNRVKKLVATLF